MTTSSIVRVSVSFLLDEPPAARLVRPEKIRMKTTGKMNNQVIAARSFRMIFRSFLVKFQIFFMQPPKL